MYLLILCVILLIVFATAVLFNLFYLIYYRNVKSVNLVIAENITKPIEYFSFLVLPLTFIQISSFVFFHLGLVTSTFGNFRLPDIVLVFGSIFNSFALLAVVVLAYLTFVNKHFKIKYILAISISLISFLAAAVFTLLILF